MGKDETLESWRRLKKDVDKIISGGESVLNLGDLNYIISIDELGVAGNHTRVSYGGN